MSGQTVNVALRSALHIELADLFQDARNGRRQTERDRELASIAEAVVLRLTAPAVQHGPNCQKCGGEIQGWTCQSCGMAFRENDAGSLVFDPAVQHGDLRERVVAVLDDLDQRLAYSMNLVRLVDGDHTYTLKVDGETLTFTDSETEEWNAQERLYAHLREVKNRVKADAILALLPADGGWRKPNTLPHPREAGAFFAAIRTHGINSPLKWEVHLIALDDETHDVHLNYDHGWRWTDYELWKPCVWPTPPADGEGS